MAKINLLATPSETNLFRLIPEGIYTIKSFNAQITADGETLLITMTDATGLKFMASLNDEDYTGINESGDSYTIDSNFKRFFAGLKTQFELDDTATVVEVIAVAKAKEFKVLNKHYTAKSSGNKSNQFSTRSYDIEKYTRNTTASSELA